MSMVVVPRTQRRDKSANGQQKQPQATAEQMRIAQIIDGNSNKEEDIEYQLVEKVMEVTGTTEDIARTALYDANNETGRAIELILENGPLEQNNEWETAGRKKGKNAQTSSSKSYDTFDDDIKDTAPSGGSRWERNESRGRGRGRNTNRRKDQDKNTDEDGNRGNMESRDRNRGGRRGRGRGSYNTRGRQPGRGPRRFQGRYNRDRSENEESGGGGDSGNLNNFEEDFGTFTNKSTENAANANDGWADSEEWDLKVGTWSNDDSKKQSEKKNDSFNEGWGTESWADDLSETKVFQSQNAQILPPTSIGNYSVQNHNQSQGTTTPQSGERINLDSLFKKSSGQPNGSSNSYAQSIGSNGLGNQSGMNYNANDSNQHTTPSVIQQLQGQSNSLFSDNKPVNDMDGSSHLFTSYENQPQTSSAGGTGAGIGQYTSSRSSDTSFSQFNGKRAPESNERGSSLLGSFGEQFKSQEKPVQSGMLGTISDLPKSAFTPLKPNGNQGVSSSVIGSDYSSYSQTQQQREATEAVKASLGLPPVSSEQVESDTIRSTLPSHTTTAMSQDTLSFGAPLPIRQTKESRRKQPPVNTKIPAAAVEMPGVGGGGYHELSSFDLQFGIDEPTANDFGSSNNPTAKPATQNSLFSNSAVTSQASLMNHIPSGSIPDASIFPNQLSGQQSESRSIQRSSYQSLQGDFSQTGKQLGSSGDSLSLSAQQANDPTSTHNSQRFSEATKQNEPLRGPPGLTHPSSLSSSTNSSGTNHASNQQTGDLSASYGSSRIVAGSNLPLSGLTSESTHEQSSISNPAHSYYTSTSLGQSQQQIGSDHSSSAGRSMRSPAPSTSLQGSLQGSPMPHMSVTPSKDDLPSAVPSTVISSLASGLGQTHITSHASGPSATSASAPLNIPGAATTNAPTLGGTGAYGSMGMHLPYSASPQSSQASVIPPVSSPGKHLPSSDLYPSSLSHTHQQTSTNTTVSSMIGLALGSAALSSVAGTPKSSTSLTTPSTKTGPPNLPLPGVPPLLPNQYGIPMGAAGLMTAYAPEAALYAGYTDPLMAVQSRVVNQMPNYYDVSSFHASSNPSANPSSVNRESSTSNVNQGKFSHREPSSPTSVIGMIGGSVGSGLAQQVAGQHNAQLKASQTGTHPTQPFVNLPTAPAAYPGYANVYYNAFQYPPMFAAAAATAVPQSGKHSVNVTTAFQQHGTGFANAYSTAASSTSSLHDLQGQGYNKNHVSAYEKQQAAFHHHTNTPPPAFNLQTLTAAMAAANTGGAGGGAAAPAMSPYNQSPFMTMLPTHQHSQIHLHVQQQHNDVGQGVGSQRAQNTNSIGKPGGKPGFGSAPYWQN